MEIKRKYIINNSKHQKQNSLDLLQIPHMQINVALHSEGIRVGIAFSSLTSVIPKQYCFSSPFYQNQFDLLNSFTLTLFKWRATMSSFDPQSFVQSWLNSIEVGRPTSRFRWNQEIACIAHKTKTWEILNMVFPALLKRWKKQSMMSTWEPNIFAFLWKTIYKTNLISTYF